MLKIEDLKKAADAGLSGLEATPEMKYRILHAAAEEKNAGRSPRKRSALIGVCIAAVLVLAVSVPAMLSHRQTSIIVSQPAGESSGNAKLTANQGISSDQAAFSGSKSATSVQDLWKGSNSDFPAIAVNGRYYRMMSISAPSAGSAVGTVDSNTSDLSQISNDGIASNTVPAGTTVYGVSGMDHTLIVAEVDGKNRVFQRISYNGNALYGGESLADTLEISGHVTEISLDGIGTVTDRSKCDALVSTLFSNASYVSASVSGNTCLVFKLDNGAEVQMRTGNDQLSACGTWSCPEFFEAFTAAIAQ